MNKVWNAVKEQFEELSMEEQEKRVAEAARFAKMRGYIIDTHNGREVKMFLKDNGIVLAKYYRYSKDENGDMKENQVDLVPLFKNSPCCINPLICDNANGEVYLSTWSIGGNVMYANIEEFNESHSVEYLKKHDSPILSCWLGRLELVA